MPDSLVRLLCPQQLFDEDPKKVKSEEFFAMIHNFNLLITKAIKVGGRRCGSKRIVLLSTDITSSPFTPPPPLFGPSSANQPRWQDNEREAEMKERKRRLAEQRELRKAKKAAVGRARAGATRQTPLTRTVGTIRAGARTMRRGGGGGGAYLTVRVL